MSLTRRQTLEGTILDAASSDGVGSAFNVTDFRHIVLLFGTANSANATVKLQGSVSGTEESDKPDFSASQAVDNHWDYVAAYDYEDASLIEGDTGISLSGADDFRILMINVDGLDWINAEVSSHSAGNITLKVKSYNNA